MTEIAGHPKNVDVKPGDAGEGDAREQVNEKLDRVATVLVGSVAAVSAALTLFGVNSSRVWTLLDDDRIAKGLLAASLLGVVAAGLALLSYLVPAERNALEVGILGTGLILYLTSLSLALWASASAADTPGRPSIVAVAVSDSNGQRTVAFTARAVSVDDDQRIGVRVIGASSKQIYYEAAVGPSDNGSAEQKAAVLVGRVTEDLHIQAWRLDESDTPDCRDKNEADGPSCVSITRTPMSAPAPRAT